MEVIVLLVRLIYHDVRQLKRQVLTRFELPRYVTICVVTPYGLSSIFLEMPLFMGRTALIIQKCFSISALFRNFAHKL